MENKFAKVSEILTNTVPKKCLVIMSISINVFNKNEYSKMFDKKLGFKMNILKQANVPHLKDCCNHYASTIGLVPFLFLN